MGVLQIDDVTGVADKVADCRGEYFAACSNSTGEALNQPVTIVSCLVFLWPSEANLAGGGSAQVHNGVVSSVDAIWDSSGLCAIHQTACCGLRWPRVVSPLCVGELEQLVVPPGWCGDGAGDLWVVEDG